MWGVLIPGLHFGSKRVMRQSLWLSLSAWAAVTAPVAFSKIITAFTIPCINGCSSIYVTSHKRSCSNQQQHASSVRALLLLSLSKNDHMDGQQPRLLTRKEVLWRGVDAIVKVAAGMTAVSSTAWGHSAAAQTAQEPEITSKCFVEVKAFCFPST